MEVLTAFHARAESNIGYLYDFEEVATVSLELPPGKYVVHGRLDIYNTDSDLQPTSTGIRVRGSSMHVDRIDLNLAGRRPFYLQGVVALPEGGQIELFASTYRGGFWYPSLVALAVDRLEPPV